MTLNTGGILFALAGSIVVCAPATAQERLRSPVSFAGDQARGVAELRVDAAALPAFLGVDRAVIEGFPISANRLADVRVDRIEVFGSTSTLVVVGPGGVESPLPVPEVVLLGGTVSDDPGSRVFLAWTETFIYGYVQDRDGLHVISSGPVGAGLTPVMYDVGSAPEDVSGLYAPPCDGALLPPVPRVNSGGFGARGDCMVSRVALETDEAVLERFGGDTASAAAYAATLTAAASQIFTAETGVRIQISYLRFWEPGTSPWDQGSTLDQLLQFRDFWNQNMRGVGRESAHMLSTRGLGGGIAYVEALCYPEYDYGLSANLNGSFPYPLVNRVHENWDPFVFSHELGHNYGTFHTHDGYNPPVDGCGLGDCSLAYEGTIMSYCHLCAGGISNISLIFGPRVTDKIRQFLSVSGCPISNPVSIESGPVATDVAVGDELVLSATATGSGVLSYEWSRGGNVLAGQTGPVLRIASASPADAGLYTVRVSNPCTQASSEGVVVTVGGCAADFNQDGFVDFFDFDDFVVAFEAGAPSSDFNQDGFVDFFDFDDFVEAFELGC